MKLSRRNILQMLGAGAASSLAARYAAAAWPTPLTPWEPASQAGTYAPRKVLEIFLRGGASQWGGFWYDSTRGNLRAGTPPGTADAFVALPDWQTITGGQAPITRTWNTRTLGQSTGPLFRSVNKGPNTPLRKLADFMRVLWVGHDLPPHEAAIPYATTGTTLGRPHQSGLGAAIWRRWDPAGPTAIRSLILQSGDGSGDVLASTYLASTGLHGSMYRPPIVTCGNPDFFNALPRPGLRTSQQEDFKKFYRNRYEALLKYSGSATPVRSAGWTSYAASLDTMQAYSQALYDLLSGYSVDLFDPITTVDYNANNRTRKAIKSAVNMLKDPNGTLKHVAVVDGGVEVDYDTHKLPPGTALASGKVEMAQNGNLWNVCDTLTNHLNSILDNNIVVLIHSEFGRIEDTSNDGTEHHTKGYANVVLGNVITSTGFTGSATGPKLAEAAFVTKANGNVFTPIPGQPTSLSPTDVHAAVASLAGIDPWQSDMHGDDLDRSCTLGGNSAKLLLNVS